MPVGVAKGRAIYVDALKAICILLVVIGHYNPEGAPVHYSAFVDYIYTFHMPAFMWASGYLYTLTFRGKPYWQFQLGKMKRLMLPYVCLSVLVIMIKLLTSGVADVEHPVDLSAFAKMFYYPVAGYFLWFLWALTLIFLIAPFFTSPVQHLTLFLVSVALCVPELQWPDAFCIAQFVGNLPYFAFGMCCADFVKSTPQRNSRWSTWMFVAASLAFIGLSLVLFVLGYSESGNVGRLVAGLIGILMIVPVSVCLSRLRVARILVVISEVSMSIYLFHTTFQGFMKALVGRLTVETGFAVDVTLIVAVGFLGPIVLHRYVLQRFGVTRWLFSLKAPSAKNVPPGHSDKNGVMQSNKSI